MSRQRVADLSHMLAAFQTKNYSSDAQMAILKHIADSETLKDRMPEIIKTVEQANSEEEAVQKILKM